jgi:spermidine/putrescine transport system substrate-binding protein
MNAHDRAMQDLRRLMARRMSRRTLLRYAGRGAGALGAGAILAACGVTGEGTSTSPTATGPATGSPTGSPSPSPTPSPLPPKAGMVNVANWPLYIDDPAGGEGTAIDQFRKATSIDIRYEEAINDNDEFFGTDLQQQIQAGQPTDWDVIVMTDWMIAKLARLGWLETLHAEALPNCAANLGAQFQDVWYDPGHAYSYPWASGITGIGYNEKLTGRPITKIADLFDPAFKGKVGMFSEMRDTYNFVLLMMGVDPTTATVEQVEEATQILQQQRDDGIVRAYYGNDYIQPLTDGDLWLTMAWSGDVNYLRLDVPDLKFVVPEEGGNRWTDNMCIPLKAEHPTDAHEWMNFVYDPAVATIITETVWYESPVAGVQEQVCADAEEDPELDPICDSELVWPTEELLANTHQYKDISFDEEEAWHDLFDPLIEG